MSVPAGYKATEVGVIPQDWEAVPLKSTAKRIIRGASPRPIENPKWFDAQSSVGWVRISDVTRSRRYLSETTQRLSQEGIRRSRPVPSGSLIMSICATVGRPIETRIDTCIHDGFVVFNEPSVDQSYLYHSLVALEPAWSNDGQTGSQMNLNTGLINRRPIALPPTVTEQVAIAEALSDADEAIAAQEAVIAKKRALKTATMQALLSGTRRLSGFTREWEEKALGRCLKVRHGRSQVSVETIDGNYPILATGGEIGRASACLHPGPSVLIGRKGTIDRPQYSEGPFWSIDTLFYTDIDASTDAKFLFYIFQMIDWRTYNEASGVPSLSSSTIEAIEVTMPDFDEQSEIAKVITDIDLDLQMNEAKLSKLRQIKAGMMQQLLTGKIRLV